MSKDMISKWCSDATQLIKFPPDREAVREELKQHLLDKQDDLREQGVPEDQIEAQAIAAMGSAEEIAPQLAAIHRPFWGYAYRVCCVILALCMVISIPLLAKRIVSTMKAKPWKEPHFVSLDVENGGKALLHTYPNTVVKVQDYIITVTQVLLYESRLFDMGQYTDPYTDFKIQIKVQHPKMYDGAEIFQYLWAEDSLGNVYHSSDTGGSLRLCNDKHLTHTYPQRYHFAYYYELSFHDLSLYDFLSEDTRWIDLHYDRDGTKFTIRIDLQGGGAA